MICIFITLCTCGQDVPSDDYNIYKTILLNEHNGKPKQVVVLNRTDKDSMVSRLYWWMRSFMPSDDEIKDSLWEQSFKTQFDSTDFVLYKKYEQMKAKSYLLKNYFEWPKKVYIVSDSLIMSFFRTPERFKTFYKRFPKANGYFTFSDVVYSDNRKSALLYYVQSINERKGGGKLSILRNKNGIWEIEHKVDLWTY